MKRKLVLVAVLLQVVLVVSFPNQPGENRNSLPGLLGFDPSHPSDTTSSDTLQNSYTYTFSSSQSTDVGGDPGFSGLFPTTTETGTRTRTSTSHSTASSTTTSDLQPTSSTASTYTTTGPTATSTATSTISAGSGSDDSKAWKVVGVAVISVITVIAIISSVIFWDRGTRFAGEVLFGKKRSDGIEDFVPDWEKRSWEVKLAEDNHRYPAVPSDSFSSLVRVPSLSHVDDDDDKRQPFPSRPGPVPVFVDFVSPDARPAENHSYSAINATELQRQNSRAINNAYTACA